MSELPIYGIPDDHYEDRRFRENIVNRFPEKFSLCKRYMDIAREKSKRDANLFLLDYNKMRVNDLIFTSSDDELQDWAKSKAKAAKRLIERTKKEAVGWSGVVVWSWFFKAAHLISIQFEDYGFSFPVSKYGMEPVLERLADHKLWLRRARRRCSQAIEKKCIDREVIGHKKKGKGGQIYCSDYALKRRTSNKTRSRVLLETMEAVNEEGQTFLMSDIYDKNVSNPKNRRAELMVRMRGFEEYAKEKGHAAEFYTITCPSKLHPSSEKYNGCTPRDAQQYLVHTWALIRSALHRRGLYVYGFRVAEPHHDGCPHWHLLLFMDESQKEAVSAIMRRYALAIDGNEKGASERRFTVKSIDYSKGSATGYIAKYIAKNIDGEFRVSGDIQEDYDTNGSQAVASGIDTMAASSRVEAWASLWGVRQFQQIGGERVSVWREARRVFRNRDSESDDMGGQVVSFAGRSDWKEFIKQCEGSNIELAKCWSDKENSYKEPAGSSVFGLQINGELIVTRFHQWKIRKICGVQRESAVSGLPYNMTEKQNRSNMPPKGALAPLEFYK